MSGTAAGSGDAPYLRVVRGNPTAGEIAALVAVLSAVAAVARAERQPPPSPWSAPSRRVRGPRQTPTAGPGGWRSSALPR